MPTRRAAAFVRPRRRLRRPPVKAVDELSDEEHARLTANADRVVGMTDEFGQTALLSVAEDRLLVEELQNAHDRSRGRP